MQVANRIVAVVAATLLTDAAAVAVPVTEVGAHFFGAPPSVQSYNGEVVRPSGSVNQTSQVVASGGPRIEGRSRASTRSLGIELMTEQAGGGVAASIFEGVQFLTRQTPTLRNTLNGYSVQVVGSISGAISQNRSFVDSRPIPDGDQLKLGSGVRLTYFEELEDRDDAVRGGGANTQTLAAFRGAGPIDVVFAAPTPDPTPPAPSAVFNLVVTNTPFNRCEQGCDVGLTGVVGPLPPDLRVASFGLGLSLTGLLQDEVSTNGSITAFNSFNLEGLVMRDPDGAIVEGLFLTDSGVDLTLDAFRPDFAVTQVAPIPLPAGALLLPAALGALALARRRRAA